MTEIKKAKNRIVGSYDEASIEEMTPLEHIYNRPGMYIGGTDQIGKHHVLNEVIDNSVDEHTSGTCDKIIVTLHNDDSITVEDNGRGIPTGLKNGIPAATLVVTSPRAGGKFNSNVYKDSGGMNGTGVAATNATSEYFETTIKRDGKIHFQRFELHFKEDGKVEPAKLVQPLHVIGECPIEETGTKIRFKPDTNFFSHTEVNSNGETVIEYYKFDPDRIKQRLEGSACLNAGLEIVFINERDEVKQLDKVGQTYSNGIAKVEILEDGSEKTTWGGLSLQDYLGSLRKNQIAHLDQSNTETNSDENSETVVFDPTMIDGLETEQQNNEENNAVELEPEQIKDVNAIYNPISIQDKVALYNKEAVMQDVGVSVAFQWFKDEHGFVKSFVNNIPTPNNGTHVKGFETAIQNTLKKYVENNGNDKVKKDFAKISNSDILEGLSAIVAINISGPTFKSQTKEQLTDERGLSAVESIVNKNFTRILEETPDFSQELINRVLRAKRARELADRARQDANEEKKVAKMSMPVKLVDCQSNDPKMRELFIVEGDSAAGSAKDARDKKYQAILPIRGKILNVYGKTTTEAFKNEEVKGIAAVLGCGTGSKLDLNKLRYHKIIILTDADEDGKHIQTLLITMFYTLYPELIKAGHIYVAKPPLFSLKKKKSGAKPIYIRNYHEYEEFFQTHDESQWEVSRFKGLGEMNYDTLRDTTMSIENSELYQLDWPDDVEINNNIVHTFEVIADKTSSNSKRAATLKEWVKDYNADDVDFELP